MSDKFLYPHTEVAEVLRPATCFEDAHVAHNYPYGSLRTDMKYWCEWRKGKGFRPVTCSLNPKTGKWNKPHAGTYTEALALYLEAGTGHIKFAHFTFYDEKLAQEFLDTFEAGLTFEGKATVKLWAFAAEERAKEIPLGLAKSQALIRWKGWLNDNKPA